ncbi:hypothetical protein DID88_007762 [Monilinia fructigena]|uniref:Uncharacterized protein n=1 Tax=Monilinia fructigena TaxID=38457 RepID=A0A395J3E4_9HELO|nr:hypothetical protein DID88_007762 [Monilinia fructigena]
MAEHSHLLDVKLAMELVESLLGSLNLFSSSDLRFELNLSLLYIHVTWLEYLGCTSVLSDILSPHVTFHLISSLHDSHTSYDHYCHDTTHLYEFHDQISDELSSFTCTYQIYITISTVPHSNLAYPTLQISDIVPASAFCFLRSTFCFQLSASSIPPISTSSHPHPFITIQNPASLDLIIFLQLVVMHVLPIDLGTHALYQYSSYNTSIHNPNQSTIQIQEQKQKQLTISPLSFLSSLLPPPSSLLPPPSSLLPPPSSSSSSFLTIHSAPQKKFNKALVIIYGLLGIWLFRKVLRSFEKWIVVR